MEQLFAWIHCFGWIGGVFITYNAMMIAGLLGMPRRYFDYSTLIDGKKGTAHAIFAWDEKSKVYKFWWFESSGNFTKATCNFVNKETLFLNWHDEAQKALAVDGQVDLDDVDNEEEFYRFRRIN